MLLILFQGCLMQGCLIKKDAASHKKELVPGNAREHTFRLLTYNVLTGFQKDAQQAERFIDWVKHENADVIGFEELSTFTQDSLERFARRYGHNYALLLKGNGSPIGITSRYPLTGVKTITESMHHGCIYAETGGFSLFVTHLSPFSYEKCIEEINGILVKAAGLPKNRKIMILGDLNSFSPADSLHYNHHRFGVIQSLLDNGFSDTFMQINHSFESSFPTLKYIQKTKAPTRIDYIFANKAALQRVAAARFIKDSVTNKLSDHYPLMIELNQ